MCLHVSGKQLKYWGVYSWYKREPVIDGEDWTTSVRLKSGCIELEWPRYTRTFLTWLEKEDLGCAQNLYRGR